MRVKIGYTRRNLAFIQFSRPEMASFAIQCLNGVKLYGRVMSACESTMKAINPPINDGKSNLTVDYSNGLKLTPRFLY